MSPSGAGGSIAISEVVETRLTGLVIHSLILSSLLFLPLLSSVPLSVVSGIFLFLGRKLMKTNLYFQRISKLLVLDAKEQPSHPETVSKDVLLRFLFLQTAMISLIWFLKQSEGLLSLLFPSCIAVMVVIRSRLLPKLFSAQELADLDPKI